MLVPVHMLEQGLVHMLELGLGHMWAQVPVLVLEHMLEMEQELELGHMLAEEQVCSWGLVVRQGQLLPRQRRQGSVGKDRIGSE